MRCGIWPLSIRECHVIYHTRKRRLRDQNHMDLTKYLLKVNTCLLFKTKENQAKGKERGKGLRVPPQPDQGFYQKSPLGTCPWQPGKSRPPSPAARQESLMFRPAKKVALAQGVEGKGRTKVSLFLHMILSPEKDKSQGNQKIGRDSARLPVPQSVNKISCLPPRHNHQLGKRGFLGFF